MFVEEFRSFYNLICYLRGPHGCSWDREQDIQSLRPFLIEECYEVLSSIKEKNFKALKEELMDLLQVVLMITCIMEESENINFSSLLSNARKKLIRRHPHVFHHKEKKSPSEVRKQWDKIKVEEEKKEIFDISKSFPPLERSSRLQKQARKQGFSWCNREEILTKLQEEIREYSNAKTKAEKEDELGDLFFILISLSHFDKSDPGLVIHHANEKFIQRFSYMRNAMQRAKLSMQENNIDAMYKFWQAAKHTLTEKKIKNISTERSK